MVRCRVLLGDIAADGDVVAVLMQAFETALA